jgi:hypothetical protein
MSPPSYLGCFSIGVHYKGADISGAVGGAGTAVARSMTGDIRGTLTRAGTVRERYRRSSSARLYWIAAWRRAIAISSSR